MTSEAAIRALIGAGAKVDAPLSWASWHRRPPAILLLCYGPHRIHPDADWSGDHGHGPTGMDANLLGKVKS